MDIHHPRGIPMTFARNTITGVSRGFYFPILSTFEENIPKFQATRHILRGRIGELNLSSLTSNGDSPLSASPTYPFKLSTNHATVDVLWGITLASCRYPADEPATPGANVLETLP